MINLARIGNFQPFMFSHVAIGIVYYLQKFDCRNLWMITFQVYSVHISQDILKGLPLEEHRLFATSHHSKTLCFQSFTPSSHHNLQEICVHDESLKKIPYELNMGGAKLFLFSASQIFSIMAPCKLVRDILKISLGTCFYCM